MNARRITIEPTRPYSLALIAQRYGRFPDPVDRYDGAAYRRLLAAGRGSVLVTVEQADAPARPRLRVTLEGSGAFPAGDLGVVKYLAEGLFEHGRRGTEAGMRAYAERWKPWRGLALVYLWADLARRKK